MQSIEKLCLHENADESCDRSRIAQFSPSTMFPSPLPYAIHQDVKKRSSIRSLARNKLLYKDSKASKYKNMKNNSKIRNV